MTIILMASVELQPSRRIVGLFSFCFHMFDNFLNRKSERWAPARPSPSPAVASPTALQHSRLCFFGHFWVAPAHVSCPAPSPSCRSPSPALRCFTHAWPFSTKLRCMSAPSGQLTVGCHCRKSLQGRPPSQASGPGVQQLQGDSCSAYGAGVGWIGAPAG